ncbi:hypothetical protein D0T25_30130 [Duganella sp. BJB488]|nr:hypothetical protein D0T26_30290 [Duganella sp. BJB489]RFP12557.1 hypothetical protein D0T25_30130 [Duganella sp. BJB488]RFP29124.1 hypothetical protein D0T24_30820 [Duganella sp. BJB480]
MRQLVRFRDGFFSAKMGIALQDLHRLVRVDSSYRLYMGRSEASHGLYFSSAFLLQHRSFKFHASRGISNTLAVGMSRFMLSADSFGA